MKILWTIFKTRLYGWSDDEILLSISRSRAMRKKYIKISFSVWFQIFVYYTKPLIQTRLAAEGMKCYWTLLEFLPPT